MQRMLWLGGWGKLGEAGVGALRKVEEIWGSGSKLCNDFSGRSTGIHRAQAGSGMRCGALTTCSSGGATDLLLGVFTSRVLTNPDST